jgi:hypothetical protein
MPGISVEVDLAPLKAEIDDIYERQVPYVASLAINKAAEEELQQRTMEEVSSR